MVMCAEDVVGTWLLEGAWVVDFSYLMRKARVLNSGIAVVRERGVKRV